MKTNKKQFVGNVRDLKVYGKALQFHKIIYEIAESLPDYERYNLIDILIRSTTSIVANLAEGNTNFYYKKEFSHLNMVLGKIGECRSALDISQMVGYISEATFANADQQGEEMLKMTIGMMRRIERFLDNEKDVLETEGLLAKSTMLRDDILILHEKAITLNNSISDLANQFPVYDNNMKDQITRASESVLVNLKKSITNSYPQSYLDINTALGSISETIAFIDLAITHGYISRNQYDELNNLGTKILNSLITLLYQLKLNNEQGMKVSNV